MIVLTDEERSRFSAFCYQEARQHGQMAKQMEHLGGFGEREKQRAAAFTIVAKEIDPAEWESTTIKGGKKE